MKENLFGSVCFTTVIQPEQKKNGHQSLKIHVVVNCFILIHCYKFCFHSIPFSETHVNIKMLQQASQGLSHLKFCASTLSCIRLRARLMNTLPTSFFDRLATTFPPLFECIYVNFVAFATSLHGLPCNDKGSTQQGRLETGAFWKQNSWQASA